MKEIIIQKFNEQNKEKASVMNIAICDNEQRYREKIISFLQPYIVENNMKIYQFESGESFIGFLQKTKSFDIVFMDIEMEEMSGIDAVRTLRMFGYDTIVIFITDSFDYISDAFRLGAFQYMMKPIRQENFEIDLRRALKLYKRRHTTYQIDWYAAKYTVKYQDIVYIETYCRHLLVHTVKKNYESIGSLKNVYQKLLSFGFIRSHQGYIVNLSHVETIHINNITMSTGDMVLLSRSERKNVLAAFNTYISGRCI